MLNIIPPIDNEEDALRFLSTIKTKFTTGIDHNANANIITGCAEAYLLLYRIQKNGGFSDTFVETIETSVNEMQSAATDFHVNSGGNFKYQTEEQRIQYADDHISRNKDEEALEDTYHHALIAIAIIYQNATKLGTVSDAYANATNRLLDYACDLADQLHKKEVSKH